MTSELAARSKAKTASDLEWALLLDRIAERASTAVGAARIRERLPETTPEAAENRFRITASVLALAAEDAPPPAGAVPDVGEVVARLERGADASALELRDLGQLLKTAATLREWAGARREEHPELYQALCSDPGLDRLAREIARAIEPDGSVSDAASPELREARKRVAEHRKSMTARLAQLIRRFAEVLSGDYYAERDGRYVLPVRSDTHVRIRGVVLGTSASGATLYVEPEEVTALGNDLKMAEARALREEARVVAELSSLAQTHAHDARQALEAAAEADALLALVRWAAETRSIAIRPDGERRLSLRGMRHPLLLASEIEVVANDVFLRSGSALVVSGPNAGGKTVALKSLGLAAWMARAGIPIPAEPGSAIGWFQPVLSEVGDDQSLVRSLSTFSAHVENVAAILELAGDRALVLLDEVAAGTDPEEGSALAAAVLEFLVERGAAVAVTTHYERLKDLAGEDNAFENASMGFDLERMEPNFRLRIGVPGPSSALAVARRHGMPQRVVERAKQLLPTTSIDREELVRRLEAERDALERDRREATAELERQRQLREELEEERATVRAKERDKLAEEARELVSAVRGARAELAQAMARVRDANANQQTLREAERAVSDAARHVAIGSPLAEASRAPRSAESRAKLAAEELVVGARVWLPRLGARAEVVELLGRNQARVLAGSLKLVASLDELERDTSARGRHTTERKQQKANLPMVQAFVPVRTGETTLDLRGQRVEEALAHVDAFIDRMLSAGERGGYVLHGHGTGALKAAVREHLAASRYVARAEPADSADGGDAFTVFWLRE